MMSSSMPRIMRSESFVTAGVMFKLRVSSQDNSVL